jgi:hypothetical protein
MNEDLAISILEIITKGESFGFMPIFNEVRKLPEFFDLTQPDFTITWNKLKEIDCLLRHDQGRDNVKLNPDKDCLKIYHKRREERLAALKPATHPINDPIKPHKNIMKSIWNLVTTNPLISGTLAGIIALLIGSMILKHYHII